MQPETLKIALWSINFRRKISNLGDWVSLVEDQIKNAKSEDVDLVILPEYVSEHWMAFAPTTLKPTDEIPWMAAQSEEAVVSLQELSTKHDIALLGGTIPVVGASGQFHNRAHFFTQDRPVITQDKLSLTPNEKDEDAWFLESGSMLNVFEWRDLKVAILTCLDIEMPALSILLAQQNVDLVLVPSMTTRYAGYHRVFGCAKARAIELQAAIAVVGFVGNVEQGGFSRGDNTSASALYLPCEEILGHHGIGANTEVTQGSDIGPLQSELLITTIPCRNIRQLRKGLAEVWPGGWKADHVAIHNL